MKSKEMSRGIAGELDGILTAIGFCLVGGASYKAGAGSRF